MLCKSRAFFPEVTLRKCRYFSSATFSISVFTKCSATTRPNLYVLYLLRRKPHHAPQLQAREKQYLSRSASHGRQMGVKKPDRLFAGFVISCARFSSACPFLCIPSRHPASTHNANRSCDNDSRESSPLC